MKDILRVILAAALWMLGFALPGCSPSPTEVPFLTSDAHFMIGGQHIVIPVVAIRQPEHTFSLASRRSRGIKEELRTEASDPTEPMKMEKIDLSIRPYQYAGEHSASVGICPLLQRNWSQTLCRGQHQGLLSRLPERFELLDRSRLDLLKS
jgi:hypothetical protein